MSDQISASEFKATCLALLDDVATNRREVVVTKRGKPMAKLVPVTVAAELVGSVTVLADDEDVFSTGEPWRADPPS